MLLLLRMYLVRHTLNRVKQHLNAESDRISSPCGINRLNRRLQGGTLKNKEWRDKQLMFFEARVVNG